MHVLHAMLFSLTLSVFPADQQVEGVHSAKGDWLHQVVDRKGSPVPQHHCLAQQGSGWAHLKLLPLQNSKWENSYAVSKQLFTLTRCQHIHGEMLMLHLDAALTVKTCRFFCFFLPSVKFSLRNSECMTV